MLDSDCIAWVARCGIADELAAHGRSCRGMRQAVKCVRKRASVHRGLFCSMEGDTEVRNG